MTPEQTFSEGDVIFLPRSNSQSDVAYNFFNMDGRTLNLKARHKELNRSLRLSTDDKEKKETRKELKHIRRQIRSFMVKQNFTDSKLNYLVSTFKEWMKEPLFLEYFDQDTGESSFHRASKRGNSIYRKLVLKKLEEHTDFMNDDSFRKYLLNARKNKTKTLFVTLTWNSNIFLGSRNKAWLYLSYYYNKFISWVRKKYGKVFVLRGTESTKAGYPHMHLLLVFKDKEFDVFKHGGVYRIRQKEEISKMWNHFVDIEVPQNLGVLKKYIFKDMIKQYSRTNRRSHQDFLSLALCWIYGLQSYSISSSSSDLIRVCIIQTQMDEIEKKNRGKNIIFRGLVVIDFSFPYLDMNKPPDYFKVKLSEEKMEGLASCRIKEPRTKIQIKVAENTELEIRPSQECLQCGLHVYTDDYDKHTKLCEICTFTRSPAYIRDQANKEFEKYCRGKRDPLQKGEHLYR